MSENSVYLFVYGSLLNKMSRLRTLGYQVNEYHAKLVKEAGYSCEWCFRSEKFKMTALGLCRKKSNCDIEGKILKVKMSDFKRLDEREIGYERLQISSKFFKLMGKNKPDNFTGVFTYVVNNPQYENINYPVKDYYKKLCNK